MKLKAIKTLLVADPLIQKIGLILSMVYGVIYYWSAGFIQIRQGLSFDLLIVPKPLELMWQIRGPFLWEPIMQVNLPYLGSIMLAIPNSLIAILLSLLVYGNLVVVLIGLRHPNQCRLSRLNQGASIVHLLPALFTGFACCAPTALILWVSIFGSVSSVLLITFRWLLPLGLLLLTYGVIRGYNTILNPLPMKD